MAIETQVVLSARGGGLGKRIFWGVATPPTITEWVNRKDDQSGPALRRFATVYAVARWIAIGTKKGTTLE